MKRAIYLVTAMLLAACSAEPASTSSADPPSATTSSTETTNTSAAKGITRINVNPPDLLTDTGKTVPVLQLFASGSKAQAQLDQLGQAVSLITWPEQTPVDTEQVLTIAKADSIPTTLELRPKSPLLDRWYAVRVKTLPQSLGFDRYAQSKKLQDGSVVWRFRTGSGPIVSSIELCNKGGQQTGALLFSERIDPGETPSDKLAFDRKDCHYLPPPVVGVPDKGAERTVKAIHFTCDQEGDLKVEWKAGARAAGDTGKAVPAKSFAVMESTTEALDGPCRRLTGDI